jgi:hypothetical protein
VELKSFFYNIPYIWTDTFVLSFRDLLVLFSPSS